LPHAIAEFQDEFPGVRIVLIDARTDEIVARVKSGEADIGVGTFDSDEEGIARSLLARDELLLFCHKTHSLATLRQPSWRDLAGVPAIMLSRESGIRGLVEKGYQSAQLSLAPLYEVAQITTALALVEAGLGISVLPTYALASSSPRRVAARKLYDPVIVRDVEVISCLGRTPPPATSEFVQRLKRHTRTIVPNPRSTASRHNTKP
jgi:DNA-binding transcriptional LysR family regulator